MPQIIGMFVFGIGMIVAWLVISRKKLQKFSGTRYRDRLVSGLVFAIFLTVANLLLSPPSTISLMYGIVLGIILMVPLTLWERAWLYRRLDGAILRCKAKQYVRNLAWCIPIGAGVVFLFHVISPELKASILVALCVSWIGGSILALLRLLSIEARLGKSVLEESEKANESACKAMDGD